MKMRMYLILLAGMSICLSPLVAPAQTRILPLGDSVTSGFAPYTSYRYYLWNDLVNAGYSVNFVGTQNGVAGGSPTNTDFDMQNDGFPGWTTQDGVDNINSIAAATQPDVVLLDLGANDVEEGAAWTTIETNLTVIIQQLRAVNPNVVVLLAEPTSYRGPNSGHMSHLKGIIARLAKQQNQDGSPVIAVNLFGGFNVRRDTYDWVHPNVKGEQIIAQKYFAALKRVL